MANRTRQVFPRDAVAHHWAHSVQESARDSSGNFFFTGRTLYSYGEHFAIAHIFSDECGHDLAGRVLWNDARYSNTTSKMQSIAFRALTRQQRESMLHMPDSIGLGRNVSPRDIERSLTDKKLPQITSLILNHVIECVSKLANKRYGSGPFESLLHSARSAEKIALAFYARAGRKYPLSLIESRPVSNDKTEWLDWIKSIAIGKMRTDYSEACKAAKHYAAQAEKNNSECTDGFPYVSGICETWHARNIVQGTYDAAQQSCRQIEKAQTLRKQISGAGLPRELIKLQARMRELADIFAARRDEFTREEKRNRIIYLTRQALAAFHAQKRTGKESTYRQWSDASELGNRATDAQLTGPYLALAQRMARVGAGREAIHALARAQNNSDAIEEYSAHSDTRGYGLDNAKSALRQCAFIERTEISEKMRAFLAPQIDAIKTRAKTAIAAYEAAQFERNKQHIKDWISGASNTRPDYSAGTYARINGAVVETSRGASVPIEHACRLARLYAITVRRGGQSWPDGAGPIVGHYRVNHIGADGVVTIGCHEFTASEAKRMHALLQECADCKAMQEEVTA